MAHSRGPFGGPPPALRRRPGDEHYGASQQPAGGGNAQWPPQSQHGHGYGDHPMSQGTAVLGGAPYSYFRYQQHLAQQNALAVHDIVADELATRFGRRYDAIDSFQLDDADYVLVMSNAFATKGRAAVERWRAQGKKVGLLRLRLLRPFPAQAIARTLAV